MTGTLEHKKARLVSAALLCGIAAIVAVALVLLPQAWVAGKGTLTVSSTQGASTALEAYQVFKADVVDGSNGAKVVSNAEWSDPSVATAVNEAIRSADSSYAGSSAADAETWLHDNVDSNAAQASRNAAVAAMARNLQSSSAPSSALTAGTAATLDAGYWLVAADAAGIGTGEYGTSPILVVVGGSPATATTKGAAPTVDKHVLENSSGAWQKQADVTVGDSLFWRLEATVPAGIAGYSAYGVSFHDTLAPGIGQPSDVHVYLAAGDATSSIVGASDTAGAARPFWAQGDSPEGDDAWVELDADEYATSYATSDAGATFDVTVNDLVASLAKRGGALESGARVCVVYDAPLTAAAAQGVAKGNPDEVVLRYPSSPYSDAFAQTEPADAVAYTWGLQLVKRSSEDETPLQGAVLRVTDGQGRHLTQDGTWTGEDATVTTDAEGLVRAAGVDSGRYLVEEVSAPEGYAAFAGTRTIELSATLDPDHIVHAQVQVSLKAADPLRADGFDADAGQAAVSVLDGLAGPLDAVASALPKTGDTAPLGALALLAAAALLAFAAHRRRTGERS